MATNSFNPSETIKFVVQNNSSQQRTIKIFNTKIGFGQKVDLMKIAGVSEEDIRLSVTKGALKTLINNKVLQVLECSVNLNTTDMTQSSFIRNNIPTVCIVPSYEALHQKDWYIDPVGGNDLLPGTGPGSALKTYAEFQKRIGTNTTLAPIGVDNILRIHILNDMPETDPITFKNFMAAGTTATVKGTEKVSATGTLSGVTFIDKSTNTPWQVTNSAAVAADYWSAHVGKMIIMTSGVAEGARAYILRDMGAKTAHVSQWMAPSPDTFSDGFAPESDNIPEPGDTFKLVTFTAAVVGNCSVGYNPEIPPPFFPDDGPPVGGLILRNLNIYNPIGYIAQLPSTIGHKDTCTGFTECIVETYCEFPTGNKNNNSGNCLFRGGVQVHPGSMNFIEGGAFLPFPGTGYPGGLRIMQGNDVAMGGNVSFVGDADSGQPCDVQVIGLLFHGSISFWDTFHGITVLPNGVAWSEGDEPFFGYPVEQLIWGDGNHGSVFQAPGGTSHYLHFLFGEQDPIVPNYVTDYLDDDGYSAVFSCEGGSPHAFDKYGTATFTAPRRVSDWSLLNTDISSGGFRYYNQSWVYPAGTAYQKSASMIDPNSGSKLHFHFYGWIPNP